MYENYKIYGPYLSRRDNRLRIVLVNLSTKQKLSMSYPKYIMECHLNRYLEDNETVDHIDGNPLNNNINNLQVLDRRTHCELDVLRNRDIVVQCTYCGKEFIIPGYKIHQRNRSDRYHSGYFCSRKCTGKYGKEVQLKLRSPIYTERIKPSKYKVKSAQLETTEVEVG